MQSKLTTLSIKRSESQMWALSRRSLTWWRDKIRDLHNPRQLAVDIMGERWRKDQHFEVGYLYHFSYNPKGRNELPYYDIFPIIILLEHTPDGFIGLNMHYLPLTYRAAFINKLITWKKGDKRNEIERVNISYSLLKGRGELAAFRPCIKRYLNRQVKSKIMAIEPHEFEAALFLPTAQFKKATNEEVWKDSIEQIQNRK